MVGFHKFCDRVLIWVNASFTSYSLPSPVYLNLCNPNILSYLHIICVLLSPLPYSPYMAPIQPPDLYKHSKLNMEI